MLIRSQIYGVIYPLDHVRAVAASSDVILMWRSVSPYRDRADQIRAGVAMSRSSRVICARTNRLRKPSS
jgi:hypothetical protein